MHLLRNTLMIMLQTLNLIEKLLENSEVASLTELENMELMSRYDTKYIISVNQLDSILEKLLVKYKVLEINNQKLFTYNNHYFDTDDNLFYTQHHNGKASRYKIRFRKYLDSDLCFFEIKHKSNNLLTSKRRLKVESSTDNIFGEAGNLLTKTLGLHPEDLSGKLDVEYNRITLLNTGISEKITIDLNIRFTSNLNEASLGDIVLIEVKQKQPDNKSYSKEILKSMNIHPISGFSKYCMGMVYTESVIKYNKFKRKLLLINKIKKAQDG